ncbi:MAG: hypothetical protein QNJ94_09135 [Alphaproteobacteria bacterium]|nr:hypothetical protein [Alphaproteobacteria bacterium]
MEKMTTMATLVLAGILAASAAQAEADAGKGRKLAQQYCARCHVVGQFNPHGGIGSTPSFQSMVNYLRDYRERFLSFYARRPHPVHVRVEGLPKWNALPSNATVIRITFEDVEDIAAFAETLKSAGQ